ncbi:acyltransferase [Cupriavidus sp. SIMBA_020]
MQLIRAFAALGVVFYHTAFVIKGGTHTEFQGVAIFFALSGFLMTYLAQAEARGERFFARRLIRIVPLYWLVTLFSVLWFSYGLGNLPYTVPLLAHWLVHEPKQILFWLLSTHGLNDWDLIGRLLKTFLFVPYRNHAGDMHPILGVGWTLNLEMFFYLVFSVSLAIGKRFAPVIAVAVIVGVKWLDQLADGAFQTLHFYANEYTWNFVFGIVVYYVWGALPSDLTRFRAPLLVLSFAFASLFVIVNAGSHEMRLVINEVVPLRWLLLAMPALVIFLCLCLHSAGARVTSKLAILLGDASYAIYLVHTILIETMRPLGDSWSWLSASKSVPGVLIAMVGSVVLGVLIHRYLERPLMNALRSKRKDQPLDGPSQTPLPA